MERLDRFGRTELQKLPFSSDNSQYLVFGMQPDFEAWARPYSIAEYAGAIRETARELRQPRFKYYQEDELVSNGFGLQFRIRASHVSLSEEAVRVGQFAQKCLEKIDEKLSARARKDSLVTFFQFPPAVRSSCEQYLLYFV